MKTELHALLVDDNPGGLEPLQVRLRPLGYRITVAQNGELGVVAFSGDVPSIVVLDVTMPVVFRPLRPLVTASFDKENVRTMAALKEYAEGQRADSKA